MIPQSTPTEVKRTKTNAGPLFKVNWKRIVADEGHVLKNPRAKSKPAASAQIPDDLSSTDAIVCALQADSRWVCTGKVLTTYIRTLINSGTPIVNSRLVCGIPP